MTTTHQTLAQDQSELRDAAWAAPSHQSGDRKQRHEDVKARRRADASALQ